MQDGKEMEREEKPCWLCRRCCRMNPWRVATYQNAARSAYFVQQYPNLFEVGGPVLDQNTEGIAVRKNDTSMVASVQAAFQALVDDGSYRARIKRWGLVSGDITKLVTPRLMTAPAAAFRSQP